MRYLPLFADLRGRRCLVIGGGETAAQKLRLLLKTDAEPLVLAATVTPEIAGWARDGAIVVEQRGFRPDDLTKVALVIVAEASDGDAEAIARAAIEAGVPVNVVDRPAQCSVVIPGIVDRDPVLVAIGSAGTSPVLVRRLREKIEALLPVRLGRLAAFAGRFRGAVARAVAKPADRRRFWEHFLDGPIASRLLRGDEQAATEAMLRLINTRQPVAPETGSVALIGAGPGDPDLLTMRALRLMQDADVVVYDALIGAEILDVVRRDAARIDVGKRKGHHRHSQASINRILEQHAKAGRRVVRLKGGDPFIFGRGGEERAYLLARGIDVQVVPGITAALGAAAASGIPLTHRAHASAVTFMTGHGSAGVDPIDSALLSNPRNTVVVYMGVSNAGQISARAIAAGRPRSTPVAVIERATRPDQRVLRGTLAGLGSLVEREAVTGPALLVIGDVTALESEALIPQQPRLAVG